MPEHEHLAPPHRKDDEPPRKADLPRRNAEQPGEDPYGDQKQELTTQEAANRELTKQAEAERERSTRNVRPSAPRTKQPLISRSPRS
jgi:hypothetical protein